MGKINKEAKHFYRNITLGCSLLVLSVVMIIITMPRSSKQNFTCEINKPWDKPALRAKFAFPVYKSSESIKQEEDSIKHEFAPYYNLNKKTGEEMIKKFNEMKNDTASILSKLNFKDRQLLAKCLRELYTTGIVSAKDYETLEANNTKNIRIIEGKVSKTVSKDMVYSTTAAYNELRENPNLEYLRNDFSQYNMNEFITSNLIYEKEKSESELNTKINSIGKSLTKIEKGELIVDEGEKVTENIKQIIVSYAAEYDKRITDNGKERNMLIGHIVFVCVLMILFASYMLLYRGDYMEKISSFLLMLALVTVFPVLTSITVKFGNSYVFIIPFCILPIFLRIFLDSRTAFTAHTISVLICGVIVQNQHEFIIVQLIAGLVAIYSLREMSRRSQVLKTAFLVVLVSCVVYFSIEMTLGDLDWGRIQHQFMYFALNGLLLLLVYPLMYVIERLFGFISDVTLVELADTNKGILRTLSESAPGTFQHSITVANLAAEVANKIGASSMLVRTGALYHDIGKLRNPVFFTENQSGSNPHDNLPYIESAKIITDHVNYGLTLADKEGLPSFIKDFIRTHHGRGMAKYFYIKQMNEHPGEHVNVDDFTYVGPNPFTKEQAILMMTDTVEAASRSLHEYTEASISGLVNKLIDAQLNEGYFRDCPINFRDIAVTKQVLTERLKSIHHTRVVYPKMNNKQQ